MEQLKLLNGCKIRVLIIYKKIKIKIRQGNHRSQIQASIKYSQEIKMQKNTAHELKNP